MVKAWYFNDDGTDQRLPHQHDPVKLIDLEKLKEKTGVLYWKVCFNYLFFFNLVD